jgi:Bacterial archaeo-eukaryotic release factor family 3
MTLPTNELPIELPVADDSPCLSLYQPTHRHHPHNLQDPIRFRNLVKSLEQSLSQEYPKEEVRFLLQPFSELEGQREFWNHTQDGLAILRAPDLLRIYKLQRPVPELAIVADSFHIKPLLRIIQSADRYQVLGLSRGEVKLFEGNRDALDEIDLAFEVPRTITDALGEQTTEPYQGIRAASGGGAVYHGQGGRKDEVDLDTERYFRAVDRPILKYHSRPSGLPLILAALPEHHTLFRSISQNPFLIDEGLKINPDAISTDELRNRAWSLVEPHYQARLNNLIEEFGQSKPSGLAGDGVSQIASAAVSGRVDKLMVEADREIPGQIDASTGHLEPGDISHPETSDILDDLAELVMNKGGQVVVVPQDRMPTGTGAAAIYRY